MPHFVVAPRKAPSLVRLLPLLLLAPVACSSPEPEAGQASSEATEARAVAGPCAEVFGGQVCTFATMAGDQVVEFGAAVPVSTVEGAPEGGEMVWPPQAVAVVPLPAEVARATGFDHLAVNWEAHGHPPGLFMTPHFDFHFYTVPAATVDATDCSDTSKPAAPPAGYALPDIDVPGLGTLVGLCVPLMGMHAMPAAEVEATEPFGASMIVGYYGGSLTFIEPMVAQVELLKRQSFELEIPETPGVPEGVRFPSAFRADWDEAAASYRLTFSVAGGM